MADDKMEIDNDPTGPLPYFPMKHRPTSPPSSSVKRPKHEPADDRLKSVDDKMKASPRYTKCQSLAAKAGDDVALQQILFAFVLQGLTEALAGEAGIIPRPGSSQADEIVATFSSEELEYWKDGVQRGIKGGDWASLISHPKIRRPSIRASSLPGENPNSDAIEGLRLAFHETKYIGKAVDFFVEYLTDNNVKFRKGPSDTSKAYYGKFCSIVQSSGTGKSLLFSKLGTKKVFVIYMNLHPRGAIIYPTRDPVPANILAESVDPEQPDYTARCCAFFAAIFKVFRHRLEGLMKDCGNNYSEAICQWQSLMHGGSATGRNIFFNEVEKEFHLIHQDIKDHSPNHSPNTQSVSQFSPVASKPTDTPPSSMASVLASHTNDTSDEANISKPWLYGKKHLVEEFDLLLSTFPFIFETALDRPKLVLAFDEASCLNQNEGQKFKPADVVCRVINAYSQNRTASIWAVFASTESKVADFSAPAKLYDSGRVSRDGQLLFPPFTELGWDQYATKYEDTDLENIAAFSHIGGFGRPMWLSLRGPCHNLESLIADASTKLCKSRFFDSSNPNQALAVLSQRLCLDVQFGHPDSVEYLGKAVASHLRICITTTEDRMWSFTAYPSEPFLSHIAAHLLHSEPKHLVNALGCLQQKIEGGMINTDSTGEMVSRILLLLCKDLVAKDLYHLETTHTTTGSSQGMAREGASAQSPTPADPSSSYPGPRGQIGREHVTSSFDKHLLFCRDVPVISFLEKLFGANAWPIEPASKEAAQMAFKHAYINFSHWVPMSEDIYRERELGSEEWTLRHWCRTSAVQCCHLQPRIDKVIPIFYKQSPPGDRENLASHILISDKMRNSPSPNDVSHIVRDHESIQLGTKRPWIAITLDLGLSNSEVRSTYPTKTMHNEACLRIWATGMNSKTFPFLSDIHGLEDAMAAIAARQEMPPFSAPLRQQLQQQFKFGATGSNGHMKWGEGR